MSIVLQAAVNERSLERGGVEIPIVLNAGQPDEVRIRRYFEFPKKGNDKQPLGPFLGVFYRIMENLEHDDVDDQSKQQALCLFFLKVFKYATVRLHDAANYYVKALNFGDCSYNGNDHYFSFEKEPYAEFLIWTEYLRKRVEKVRELRGDLHEDESVPSLTEQVIIFDSEELDKERSPQRIISRILQTCLGERFYRRDAHASKVNVPDIKGHVKLCIFNDEHEEFLTRPVIAFMQMLAAYKYMESTEHPFLGIDEITVINLAGSYFLTCVYASPIIILRNGVWRMLIKLMVDAKIAGYKTRSIRLGRGPVVESMPKDQYYYADQKKMFIRGTAEFWLGRELAHQYATTPKYGLNLPLLEVDLEPDYVSGLFAHAQMPLWPDHKPLLRQIAKSARTPSPLGGYSTVRARR
ncbi:unnamed protein product [Oikopleura dioica]|nr:unnamed protein product [Oikopleura dioica]